jgi:hypothetical protein
MNVRAACREWVIRGSRVYPHEVRSPVQLGGELTGWDVDEVFRGARPEVAVVYAGCYGEHRRPVAGTPQGAGWLLRGTLGALIEWYRQYDRCQ